MSKLIDSGIVLAFLTGSFYTIGAAYSEGYLSVMNITSSMMETNFHRVIYNGFLVILIAISKHLIMSFLVVTFIYILGVMFFAWKKNNKKKFKELRGKAAKRSKEERVWSEHFIFQTGILCGLFIIGMIWVVTFKYGEGEGVKILTSYNQWKGSVDSVHVINIKIPSSPEIEKLFFIGCGSFNCAGVDKDNNRVHYFPQSLGYSFVFDSTESKDTTSNE